MICNFCEFEKIFFFRYTYKVIKYRRVKDNLQGDPKILLKRRRMDEVSARVVTTLLRNP
jgi:hypothetical protein